MEQALRTELILEKFFQCFTFANLKELRLVCKQWNKFASAELRKRACAIPLDQDSKSLKQVYNLELSLKNKDITAKIPMIAHVRRGAKNDWKILKDVATHDSWRTRIVVLQLSDFWASDLNHLLPFLLDQLTCLNSLRLITVNIWQNVDNTIIPKNYKIPEVCTTKKFPLEVFHAICVPEIGITTTDISTRTLDPSFLRQCTSLWEFFVVIPVSSDEGQCFYERLNHLKSLDKDFLASCDFLKLPIIPEKNNSAEHLKPLVQFICNTQPRFLDLSGSCYCECDENVSFATLLQLVQKQDVRILALAVDVPSPKGPSCSSDWLFKTLKKFKVLAELEELNLKLETCTTNKEPQTVDLDLKHDLPKLTLLKVGFNPKVSIVDVDKYKCLLEDAAHHLRNVTRLILHDWHIQEDPSVTTLGFRSDFTGIFEGIRHFRGLKDLEFRLEDFGGNLPLRGVQVIEKGEKGLFEPLSLLSGSSLETFTLSIRYHCDFPLQMTLPVFFGGYEPAVKVNLNIHDKNFGHIKKRYTKEQLKKQLDTIPKGRIDPLA